VIYHVTYIKTKMDLFHTILWLSLFCAVFLILLLISKNKDSTKVNTSAALEQTLRNSLQSYGSAFGVPFLVQGYDPVTGEVKFVLVQTKTDEGGGNYVGLEYGGTYDALTGSAPGDGV
jgi:hypothetical protein